MAILGWKAGPEQYPPNELLDYAVAAEQAGFDALEASDHFNPWSEAGQASFVWTWLGAAAVKTQKMLLGTGITCPILRYHPAVIAQAAATLGVMAPNRAFLSVGTGESLNEYTSTGQWPGYSVRREMLAEAIELMRKLWTGEEVSYSGTYYETKKARLYTLPQKPVPLYISSMVPDSAEFAGRYGDGLITVGGQPPEVYQKLLQNFEKGARDAGKDPSRMPRLIELNVIYTDNLQAGIDEMLKYWAGTFIPALFDQKIYTPKMSAQNGKAVGADTVKKMCCVSSNPDDHIQFIQEYLDLGFDQLYFHSPGPDQQTFLQSYGRDVLAKVRQKMPSGDHQQRETVH